MSDFGLLILASVGRNCQRRLCRGICLGELFPALCFSAWESGSSVGGGVPPPPLAGVMADSGQRGCRFCLWAQTPHRVLLRSLPAGLGGPLGPPLQARPFPSRALRAPRTPGYPASSAFSTPWCWNHPLSREPQLPSPAGGVQTAGLARPPPACVRLVSTATCLRACVRGGALRGACPVPGQPPGSSEPLSVSVVLSGQPRGAWLWPRTCLSSAPCASGSRVAPARPGCPRLPALAERRVPPPRGLAPPPPPSSACPSAARRRSSSLVRLASIRSLPVLSVFS